MDVLIKFEMYKNVALDAIGFINNQLEKDQCWSSMIISTLNAEPIGTIIFDGKHRPFHALACPLQAHLKQIHQKKEDNSSY